VRYDTRSPDESRDDAGDVETEFLRYNRLHSLERRNPVSTMANPTIDRTYLYQTLADLVRIDSINPSLTPGGAGERASAAYLTNAMQQLGLSVTQHEPAPDRISVVGTLRGTGGGQALMLNGHIDTVGVEHMPHPFSAEIRDGKLYGRGAYDMKGSVAAMLAAAKALRDAAVALKGDVLLAAVADEEYASLGTADVATRYRPDAAIVAEPTERNSPSLTRVLCGWKSRRSAKPRTATARNWASTPT
jgi:acetylornithine deacetylase